MESIEQREQLARCVGELGEAQRAVVNLRMLDEVPGEDVARQLGIAPGNVAVLLHRAKASLATCMAAAELSETSNQERSPANPNQAPPTKGTTQS